MAKKKQKVQTRTNEEVKEKVENVQEEKEITIEKSEEEVNKEKLSEEIKKFVSDIKEFVVGYEKYHNIQNLNPLKDTLAKLQKEKDLEPDDKIYLARINRTIYAKTLQKGEQMPEHPKTLVVRSLQEKVDRLSDIANGYGDKSFVTTITDSREDAFYCIKGKQLEEKEVIEESLKVTNVGGAYLAEGMEEQEVNEIINKYKEMPEKDYEDENGQKVVNIFTKEIKNDPNYAHNYYSKICEGRKLEAQDKNKELDKIEEENEEEATV